MQITFYGTGSCRPSPKVEGKSFRSYTGWYTEIGENSLLFDIGSGLLYKMLSDGKDVLKKPSHLFISHFHADHWADLIQLMQGRVNADEKNRIESMFLAGPQGLNQIVEDLFEGDIHVLRDSNLKGEAIKQLNLKEIMEGGVYEDKDFKVICSPITHFNGICYRLDAEGKSVVYSGDMAYDERICKLGKDADLAIVECSYPDGRSDKHIGPEEIGKLAKLGNFKKIVLTHMFPDCEGREEEMVKTIRNIHDVDVIVGYDFLKIEV